MLFLLAAIVTIPLGLDLYLPVPEDNPLTLEGIELGKRLFLDRRLSRDGSLSCAGCHDPERAFSDGRPVAIGIHDRKGTRNAPALIDRAYGRRFFWDGRAATLEDQVLEPITNPKELDLTLPEAEARVGLPSTEIARALASYVRSILSGDSTYDRYIMATAPPSRPRPSRACSYLEARRIALPATSPPLSPTSNCTTPGSPGGTASSPTKALDKSDSRRPRCGKWLGPHPTCTMAVW